MGRISHATKQTEQKIKQIQESGKVFQRLLIEEKTNQDKANTELQKQIEQLKKDLQAKAATKQSVVASFIAPPQTDGSAKMWIYMHESGNRPTARNSIGCLGLGQACPGSKLLAVCPDLNDYTCQDIFFTNYMRNRYGTWENAKAFWLSHNWW